MPNSIETQNIIFEGQGKSEIFSFRPENIEKEKRGNLFLLGKIAKHISRNDTAYYALNSIAAIFKKEYYSNSYNQTIDAFEGALKKVNSMLNKLNADVLKSLELVAFGLAGNQVAFSCVGNCEILLVRDERLFRLAKHHPESKRLFLHVTRGKIKTQDTVIIASSELTYWMEHSSFSSRLLKRPWERTIEQLRQERSELGDNKSWALLKVTLHNAVDYSLLQKEQGTMQEVAKPAFLQEQVASSVSLPRKEAFNLSKLLDTAKHYWIKWNAGQRLAQGASFLKQLSQRILNLGRRLLALDAGQYIRKVNRFPSVKTVSITFGVLLLVVAGIIGFMGSRTRLIKDTAGDQAGSTLQGATVSFPKDMVAQKAVINSSGAYIISQNKLFRVNTGTKKIEPFLSFDGQIKAMASSGQYVYVIEKLSDGSLTINTVTLLQPSVKKDTLIWPLGENTITSALEYQGNLYVLENSSGQIVKYKIPQFSKPLPWITKKAQGQLASALDFSIDSSVYLAQQDKFAIIQLRLGQIDHTIPLPLGTHATRVITSPELKNLYVFDTSKGEMFVIDKKTQTLASTFANPKITDLQTAWVDETENLLTIVTSQGVFTIPTQQNKTP